MKPFSSGYDHVLLLSYLVPLLYELGHRPKIFKKGNKVSAITLKSGIAFRDVAKLLAPSTSLRKFGQLFGLEQKKAHFPFKALTNVAVLSNPLECLPPHSDPCWENDLAAVKISEAEVAEAQRLYNEAKCSCLGDYLKAYLWLDVEILFKSIQLWRSTLSSVIGLDFLQARKYTISGLSYTAGLKNLEKHLRIGCFAVNNSQHYRLLKRGMRGYVMLLRFIVYI